MKHTVLLNAAVGTFFGATTQKTNNKAQMLGGAVIGGLAGGVYGKVLNDAIDQNSRTCQEHTKILGSTEDHDY